MFEKHLWVSDILSKDAGRWPFASKNQLPGLSVIGTLVENGLMALRISETLAPATGEESTLEGDLVFKELPFQWSVKALDRLSKKVCQIG